MRNAGIKFVTALLVLLLPVGINATRATGLSPSQSSHPIMTPVKVQTTEGKLKVNKDVPGSVLQWFENSGQSLYETLIPFVPKISEDNAQPRNRRMHISPIQQVQTWSAQMLKEGKYADGDLENLKWWVVGVAIDDRPIGIILHHANGARTYPSEISLPTKTSSSQEKTTQLPKPPLTVDNEGQLEEPKNSAVPVGQIPNGKAYVLPKMASAIIEAEKTGVNVQPIWDESIKGWFILNDSALSAVNDAAAAHVAGTSQLSNVAWAIASWWGMIKPASTISPDVIISTVPVNDVLIVLMAALIILGIFGALLVLPLRRFGHWADDSDPLPDPEMVIINAPAPAPTATPTSTSSMPVVTSQN